MTLAQGTDPHPAFWIAEWHIDPASCRIANAEKTLKLEPKVMNLLVCLARNAGKVMTREQLEAEVWRGTVVGYDSLASSIIKLRRAFGDDSRNPRIIETVPKRGYRLIAEVRATPPAAAAGPAEPAPPSSTAQAGRDRADVRQPRFWLLVAVAIAIIAFTARFGWDGAPAPADRAIAVLPFANLSNDPDQDYFSDGITADLITDLSKISSLAVIARNSVFRYKGRQVDVRELRDELGVTYVVEGSVRKAGDRVRISASLIDTRNGHNLWAERFDGDLKNIFGLQDEVTRKVVASLAIRLTEHEQATLAQKYTRSVEAYDEFLQGWQRFWILSRDSNPQARRHFRNAIALDGNFARAYANLALTYAYDYINAWDDDPERALAEARRYAGIALGLDPALPQVHWVMGLIHMFGKDYRAALDEAQQTLKEDPNFADGHGIMAAILNYAGRPDEALPAMHKAMRLNPHHPHIYLIIRGEIHFNLRDYDDAVRDLETALDRNPEAQEARLWLAAAYAHSGRTDEAGWQLEHIRHAGIELSLDYVERVIPFNDPQQRAHLLEGLHKAGLAARF